HPSNQPWFIQILGSQSPQALRNFLAHTLTFSTPREAIPLLSAQYAALYDAHPDLMDIYSIRQMYYYGDDHAKAWLRQHFDRVVEVCLQVADTDVWEIPTGWGELKAALSSALGDKFLAREAKMKASQQRRRKNQGQYETTQIWQTLQSLFEQANIGDNQALQ